MQEEEELRRALALSVGTASASGGSATGDNDAGFVDADFVSQLLGDNVDRDDPLLQAALAQLGRGAADNQQGGAGGGGNEDKSKKRKGPDGEN